MTKFKRFRNVAGGIVAIALVVALGVAAAPSIHDGSIMFGESIAWAGFNSHSQREHNNQIKNDHMQNHNNHNNQYNHNNENEQNHAEHSNNEHRNQKTTHRNINENSNANVN